MKIITKTVIVGGHIRGVNSHEQLWREHCWDVDPKNRLSVSVSKEMDGKYKITRLLFRFKEGDE